MNTVALDNLSIDELILLEKEIQQKLKPARQFLPDVTSSSESNEANDVLSLICDVLQSMGVEYPVLSVLQRNAGFKAFKEKLPGLFRYLQKSGLNKNEQRAVLRVGILLLYENLMQMGLPISAARVMQHTHRIPSILENQFPGYASAGLLRMLVSR